jgi:uncharacterized RDD family membrane protein YckC
MPAADQSALLDTTVEIETPEHVRFRYRVAGPARRALAYLIDTLVRAALFVVVLIVAVAFGLDSELTGIGAGMTLLALFVIEWAYFVVSELAMRGQSIGKRALELRVVKEDGTSVGGGDSLLRNLLRAADFLPAVYALGVVVMCRDRAFRRLGDLAAGTLVVHESEGRIADPIDLASLPPLGASVPVELTAAEIEVLELFARRRTSLSHARMRELAQLVAPQLARRLGLAYQDPATFLLALYRRVAEGPA